MSRQESDDFAASGNSIGARHTLKDETFNLAGRARFSKFPAREERMIFSMSEQEFTFFDTAVGRCGIAWGARGVVGVQLPEKLERLTRMRLLRRFPDARAAAPPPEIRRAIDDIAALLCGKAIDLGSVTLDMTHVPAFERRVYEVARRIPAGLTLTYGEIAARIGAPGSARAVGRALGRNPFAIIVPCHRVVAAGGKIGGFSANGGTRTKRQLLEIESGAQR
jgi:methylated-DNA-[protein]-cysteine S-methyltransferase